MRCDRKDRSCVVVADAVPRHRWGLLLAEVEDWACWRGLRVEVEAS